MRRMTIALSAGFIAAGYFAAPASASYMSTCNALISEWETCRETGAECKVQTMKIETNCKCHVQKGGEWKLVMAAVADDGVCGKPPEDIIIPPPPPPPPTITEEPRGGGAGGKGEGEHRGDGRN